MKKCVIRRLEPHRVELVYTRNMYVAVAFFLGVLAICFLVLDEKPLLLPFFIFLVLALVFLIKTIKAHMLLSQFARIQSTDTYEVKLYKPVVKFNAYASNYSAVTHRARSLKLDKVYLKGSDKKIYSCFLDHDIIYDNANIARIREKLDREISISCYKNTSIVCLVENDPYFFRIGC